MIVLFYCIWYYTMVYDIITLSLNNISLISNWYIYIYIYIWLCMIIFLCSYRNSYHIHTLSLRYFLQLLWYIYIYTYIRIHTHTSTYTHIAYFYNIQSFYISVQRSLRCLKSAFFGRETSARARTIWSLGVRMDLIWHLTTFICGS